MKRFISWFLRCDFYLANVLNKFWTVGLRPIYFIIENKKVLSLLFIIGASVSIAIHYDSRTPEIAVVPMAISLLAGLSIFLYGMTKMEKALDRIAGHKMKKLLNFATKNRFIGVATGAATTAAVNSSSITTVLLVNLVSTGVIAFSRTIPVIFGANIGSTITTQILAFDVDVLVPYFLVFGFVMMFSKKNKEWHGPGTVIFGLALIFFGMILMKDAMLPLRSYEPFIDLMANMSNPFWSLLIASVFTALVQSSAATMGIVVALALNGLIGIEVGIALALGANIGTCATAMLAAIGKNVEAYRVAVAHTIFNISGSLLFVFFIPQLTYAVGSIGGEIPRQIANAHTIFNIVATLIFLPFSNFYARCIVKLVPKFKKRGVEVFKDKYLISETRMHDPMGVYFGLIGVKLEVHRMGKIILSMFKNLLSPMLSGSKYELEEVALIDKKVNLLNDKILSNIMVLRRLDKTEEQVEILNKLEHVSDELERSGDTIKRLVYFGEKRIDKNIDISKETQEKITQMHVLISKQIERVLEVIEGALSREEREVKEKKIIREREVINQWNSETIDYLEKKRSDSDTSLRIEAFKIERNILRYMERFYKKMRHIAELGLSKHKFEDEINLEEDNNF